MARRPALPGQRAAQIAALKKHLRTLLIGLAIGVVSGVMVMVLGSFEEGFVARTELLLLDVRYRTRPHIPVHPDVALINYDDASLALFGGWPWPRHRQVALVTVLDLYDARAAGYDVFFSERNDIIVMDERLRQFVRSDEVAKGRPAPERVSRVLRTAIRDYDREFERAIAKSGNIYLGYFVQEPDKTVAVGGLPAIQKYVEEDKKSPTYPHEALESLAPHTIAATPDLEKHIFKMSRVVPPLSFHTRAARSAGFAQIVKDLDHTVRLYPMFMYYDGKIHPSIGCVMVASVTGVPLDRWVIKPGEYVELPDAKVPGETNPVTIRIPVNENGQMLMNWAAKFDDVFLHVSFRLISEYYAYHTAKGLARNYPADPAAFGAIYADIVSSIDEEQMVTEEESRRIAGEIALAHIATPMLKAGATHADILSRLKLPDGVAAPEQVLQAVDIALQKSGGAAFDAAWQAEIERNVSWFVAKNRLNEVEPLFFPPARTALWQGKQTAFSPLDLENKIFMIGLTGVGTIDLNPMPFESVSPMVGMHSNALNTMLAHTFLKFPKDSWRYPLDMVFAIVTAVVGALTSPFIGFLVVTLIVAGYSYAVWWAFAAHGQWIQWLEPVMAISLTYIGVVVYHFIQARREKGKVRAIFAAMVSPDVLKYMEEHPESFSLTGVRKAGTTFFSSVERFGKVTAGVAPDELGGILSYYLTPTSEIIMDYQGYIDKYEGHVIMADFGVPIDDPGHAWKCCYAAIEQQQDILPFQFFVKARYGVDVFVAMGINSGYVSAGNMGSEKKMQYTVMGDAVNMSARFRPANNIYDTRIIAGEPTLPFAGDCLELRLLDKLLAKGKTKPATIYEIQGWNPKSYLELKKDAPVPPSLLSRWSKCPAEKIFGYHRFWQQKEKDFAHPLIPKIREFFESQLAVAEEMIKVEGRSEVRKYCTELYGVRDEAAIVLGKKVDGMAAPGKPWDVILDKWISTASEIHRALEESRQLAGQSPEIYKAYVSSFSRAATLTNKLETLKARLAFHAETESVMERFIVDMHESIEKTAEAGESAPAPDGTELETKRAAYRSAVQGIYDSLAAKPAEYHEMMSQVGSVTESQKKAREIFVEGVNLHWERKWDESIEKFRAVLDIMPADGPSKSYIERVHGYKTDPPGDKWQGEFVQKKK
ncbi:MAG: hypothetical protein A3G34_14845 [Candidatus Lindowbacteria bacterium RIFCSPLOWO2_12_FULL_62_27]|nr:MAG: hypothetical protein A3I06_10125 [Candidatus Lindowbacteria bacterium RIFCSPLOWO2_02_FULL_62_12]OGH63132.1 MAG: hypothetical protein A3G34_14845 [Candidatus Lindowbacteria bacterium RIFCSPLOWO2_12_FULL_62_27]